MGAAGKYVHKLVDSPAEVTLTNVYTATGRKDLVVPNTQSSFFVPKNARAVRHRDRDD